MAFHSRMLLLVACTWLGASLAERELTFQEVVDSGRPYVVLFTSSSKSCASCSQLTPLWSQFVRHASKSDVGTHLVDCSRQTHLCAERGVWRYPRIEVFALGAEERYVYYGNRRPENLAYLAAKHGNVKDSVHISQGLSHLTRATYERHVAYGVHFVLFHAHWCSHCRNMMPAWKQLALTLANNPTFNIASVECEEEVSVCQSFAIKGYPTLILLVDGAVYRKYDGMRDVSSMLEFLYKSTGLGTAPGTHSVSAAEVRRLAMASKQRFQKFGSGVAPVRSQPALSPSTTQSPPAAVHEAVKRFSTELLDWIGANRDSSGKIDAKKLVVKVQSLVATHRKPLPAQQQVMGSDQKPTATDFATQFAKELRGRGINAEVKTIQLGKLPPGVTTTGARFTKQAKTGNTGRGATANTGGRQEDEEDQGEGEGHLGEEDTSDESVARLQNKLEAELNEKLRRHLENGDISQDQLQAVQNFMGKLPQGGNDLDDVQLNVEDLSNGAAGNFLSADDVRTIREAVTDALHRAQQEAGAAGGGGLAGGVDVPVAGDAPVRVDGGTGGLDPQVAQQLNFIEAKLEQELAQRLQTGGTNRAGAQRQQQQQEEPEPFAPQQEDASTGTKMSKEEEDVAGDQAGSDRVLTGSVSTQMVVELTPQSFETVVANVPVFVYFYAPWCKHCQTFAPVWEKLGERLFGVKGILIAKFNCHTHVTFCQEKEIPSFPELVLFKSPNKQIHYSGVRDVESFFQYVMNHVPVARENAGLPAASSPTSSAATDGIKVVQEEVLANDVSSLWHLAADEFEEAISNKVSLILFTAQMCQQAPCRESRSSIEQVASEVDDVAVTVAQVDCARLPGLCDSGLMKTAAYGWFEFYSDGQRRQVVHVTADSPSLKSLRHLLDVHRSKWNANPDGADEP